MSFLYEDPITYSDVPQGVGEQSQDRPFAALVSDAKAVAQITGSFSLKWPAPVYRFPRFATVRVPFYKLITIRS